MRNLLLLVFAAMITVGIGSPACAAVIYDNGSGGQNSGALYSDLNPVGNGAGIVQEIADDFSLSSPAVIRDVHFWGSYIGYSPTEPYLISPVQDAFILRVFALDTTGNIPGNLLAERTLGSLNRVDTGIDMSFYGLRLYRYDSAVADLPLADGRYFLEIANNTTSDGTAGAWVWASAANNQENVNIAFRYNNVWDELVYGPMAFNLTGDAASVPEPATMLLLVLSLVGLAGVRRKFKSNETYKNERIMT